MPLIWLVLAMLVFFGAYSLAPVFGLDEIFPELLGADGTWGRWILVALMLLGGLYWRGWWIQSRKRQRGDRGGDDRD